MSKQLKKSWKPVVLFAMYLAVWPLCGGCGQSRREILPVQETETAVEAAFEGGAEQNNSPAGPAALNMTAPAETARSENVILVHVCGAVERPGIYTLPEGSRLWEAVKAAGGVLETGAEHYLNMAAAVSDGEKIVVPFLQDVEQLWGEAEKSGSENPDTAEKRVDLNTADLQQLMTLPGIGEAKAKAILEYREQTGRFLSVEDVKNVPGIKDGAYAKIKDYIMVSR